jgi:ketosteroid isomerase-like protein
MRVNICDIGPPSLGYSHTLYILCASGSPDDQMRRGSGYASPGREPRHRRKRLGHLEVSHANPVREIDRLEDERYGAMRLRDLATLDRLLHEDLLFVHSSGFTDTKSSYLAGLRDGRFGYLRLQREDQLTRVCGPVALVFNRVRLSAQIRGILMEADSRDLAVWLRTDDAWRLIAHQSGCAHSALL